LVQPTATIIVAAVISTTVREIRMSTALLCAHDTESRFADRPIIGTRFLRRMPCCNLDDSR
jgi:hypothetical protein